MFPETKKGKEITDIDLVMQQSQQAFEHYKNLAAYKRAAFLVSIADEIEKIREQLVETANKETNLPAARLNGEITRTINQLKLFAQFISEGSWIEAAIDTADAQRTPPRPDIRKMLVPSGPVIVFGASNFPFAFSTAGGDTASALAAGCSVVVKGHSAHAETSSLVFDAIQHAIKNCDMPTHLVQHVLGSGNIAGKALAKHPNAAGVGFTGSFAGGKALCDYSNERENLIPVFAEMSSINPVVFFENALHKKSESLAQMYAASITLGMGQFCTNPGILIALKSETLNLFMQQLSAEINKVIPQKMLHEGICHNYNEAMTEMLQQNGVEVIGHSAQMPAAMEAYPMLAKVTAKTFLSNQKLKEEVFGPFSLMVVCDDADEMKNVLQSLKGQLTTTIMATDEDLNNHKDVIELQKTLAGRIIINGVPTGVEVCAAMVHGGPFPATTDSRFTSVGASSIKRWVRPLCYQGFPDELLPDELKNSNPLNIWRMVNSEWTKENPLDRH